MTTLFLHPEISLLTVRCWRCRRWYAHERNENSRCPHCAGEDLKRAHHELDTARRQLASQKGVAARLRRKLEEVT